MCPLRSAAPAASKCFRRPWLLPCLVIMYVLYCPVRDCIVFKLYNTKRYLCESWCGYTKTRVVGQAINFSRSLTTFTFQTLKRSKKSSAFSSKTMRGKYRLIAAATKQAHERIKTYARKTLLDHSPWLSSGDCFVYIKRGKC